MNTQFDADVIVIGSGALGSNAANVLARKGHSVIILEAGEKFRAGKSSKITETRRKKGTITRHILTNPGLITLTTSNTSKIQDRLNSVPVC